MGGESRERLVGSLRRRVQDERVLAAIAAVPRDLFVPEALRERAWLDEALPIGGGQTISQPLVVALMCELLEIVPGTRVLDVGTGSGYHAAVLAALGAEVWSVERDPSLSAAAGATLAAAGVRGVTLLVGDGSLGWPDHAPYEAINVAAAARDRVPPALEEQLAPGGRLVIPVGDVLVAVRRHPDGTLERRGAGGVRFVPLIEERSKGV
jgi:protein-L-isoaspartate(D-aspartate) O-methyltransferase